MQTRLVTAAKRPYLIMTTARSLRLLVCAQEVAPAPSSQSACRSLRPAARLYSAGHPNAQEPCRLDDLALPQAHLIG